MDFSFLSDDYFHMQIDIYYYYAVYYIYIYDFTIIDQCNITGHMYYYIDKSRISINKYNIFYDFNIHLEKYIM